MPDDPYKEPDDRYKETDIIIEVAQHQIKAHRSVLSKYSDYFDKMFLSPFNEGTTGHVTLHRLEYKPVKLIIDHMYNDDLKITSSNVQGLLETADFLQIPSVREKCERHMLSCVNPTNCLHVYQFSIQYNLKKTEAKCLSTALQCFVELAEDNEYLDCSYELLHQLLSSSELNISDEMLVFDVFINWIQHHITDRLAHMDSLIDCVRFSLLNKTQLNKILQHPLLSNSKHLMGKGCAERIGMLNNRIYLLNGFCHSSAWSTKRKHNYDGELIEAVMVDTLESKIISRPSPVSVYGAGCAVINHTIYIAGGLMLNNNKSCDNFWSFSPHTQEWKKLPSLPTARHHMCVTAVDGLVYTCGGLKGEEGATDTVEVFDPERQCWFNGPPMTYSRGHACCIGVSSGAGMPSRTYVIGGYSQNKMSSVEVLSSGKEWSNLPSMLRPRHEFGAGMVDGMIIVVGGWSEPSVERYDFRCKQWSFLNAFSKHRNCIQAVVCDGRMFVLGGSESSHYSDTIELYKPDKDLWVTIMTLKLPRIYASLAVL